MKMLTFAHSSLAQSTRTHKHHERDFCNCDEKFYEGPIFSHETNFGHAQSLRVKSVFQINKSINCK